ncbi:MAG: ATP synthase subunit C [Clostridia bacterium]|nr:ATP synthase subunit C [Clostridia bacterium]
MKKYKPWYRIAVVAFIVLIGVSVTMIGFAAATGSPSDDSAPVPADAQAAESSASSGDLSRGLAFIAAGLTTALAGIGGGIAVAAGAPAAIAAASEDPKSFGKSLIFVALGESIALYGVVISILILNKL